MQIEKHESQPTILIIIANYNGEKFLSVCLNAIWRTDYANFETAIVDDGSTDNSLNIIESFRSKLKLQVIKSNHQGAAKARNLAIEKFKDQYDLFVFLDNDTEVTSGWLTGLVNAIYKNPKGTEIYGAQSLLIDFENRSQIQSAGIKLIPHVCWGISLMQYKNVSNLRLSPYEIAAISACLAVRTSVFKKLRPFDELLAVSTEDIDFTWRMWICGFSIVLAPESLVFHYTKTMAMRKDMNVNLEKQYFHITKNSFRSIFKNYSLFYLLYYLWPCLFVNLSRALLVFLRRKDFSALRGFIKAVVWNLRNMQNLYKERSFVQKNRVFTDKEIYEKIMLQEGLMSIYSNYFSQTKLLG